MIAAVLVGAFLILIHVAASVLFHLLTAFCHRLLILPLLLLLLVSILPATARIIVVLVLFCFCPASPSRTSFLCNSSPRSTSFCSSRLLVFIFHHKKLRAHFSLHHFCSSTPASACAIMALHRAFQILFKEHVKTRYSVPRSVSFYLH